MACKHHLLYVLLIYIYHNHTHQRLIWALVHCAFMNESGKISFMGFNWACPLRSSIHVWHGIMIWSSHVAIQALLFAWHVVIHWHVLTAYGTSQCLWASLERTFVYSGRSVNDDNQAGLCAQATVQTPGCMRKSSAYYTHSLWSPTRNIAGYFPSALLVDRRSHVMVWQRAKAGGVIRGVAPRWRHGGVCEACRQATWTTTTDLWHSAFTPPTLPTLAVCNGLNHHHSTLG